MQVATSTSQNETKVVKVFQKQNLIQNLLLVGQLINASSMIDEVNVPAPQNCYLHMKKTIVQAHMFINIISKPEKIHP